MLSLNEVFKESMRMLQSEVGRSRAIVRCDNLPQVKGNKQDMTQAFEELIRMIMSTPAPDGRLFLYLDCAEMNGAEVLDEGFKSFTIKFRTNILPGKNWEASHKEALEKCRNIFSLHQAVFHVNSNNTNGCLFSISLPGKS